jgi:excisionase family DNA binding protein
MYAEHRLNVRETATRLGVHENTVRNWEEKGLLRAVKLPGSGYRRFDEAEGCGKKC